MKTQKTELRFFDIMDYEKEADYLTRMHRKGWKFAHVSFPGLYHFVKCEPQDVRYQLDYNQDGVANLEEYKQMFADMGWEYLFDFFGYSYFRKPSTGAEEDVTIFCDDDSRWEMMKRIFRGRMIPLIILFCLVICPTLAMGALEHNTKYALPSGFLIWMCVIFILYALIFLRFAVKYLIFKRKMGK